MYDTIIIGTGPAGMTAAIYAVRREMKTLVVGKEVGGQMMWASEIENYPGFKNIQASELVFKMQEQVQALGVEMKTAEVKKIEQKQDKTFVLYTEKEKFEAKTVIVTMGLSPRRLEIPGETEFNGKGVTYCANCDGPFYKDKVVAVVGGGNSALDAAEVMSKIAKKVYLVHRRDEFKAFDALVSEVKSKDNVEFILSSKIEEIMGGDRVEKIKVLDNNTKKSSEIKVDGVFIEIGRIASTDLVADFVERTPQNQIVVDEKQQTKTDGIYAAGDVVQSEFKQITIACGQATVAALSAYQYLQIKAGRPAEILDRSVANKPV